MDTALSRKSPPRPGRRQAWSRYGLALVATLISGLLTLLLMRYAEQGVFALFFAAVFVSARYGGAGPGILATVLTSICAAVVILPALRPLAPFTTEAIPLVLYCAVSVLTTSILHKLRLTTESLRTKEAHLTDFVENAKVGMNWVAEDGRILWANKAELHLLDYAPAEYIGHNLREFFVDAPAAEDILGRLARHEPFENVEANLRARDGSIKTVLVHANVLLRDGEYVRARCFTQDITARRLAEVEMQNRAQQQEVVARLGQLAAAEGSLENVLQSAVASIQSTLGVDNCHILELGSDRRTLAPRQGSVAKSPEQQGSLELDSEAGYSLTKKQPVIPDDVQQEKRFKVSGFLQELGATSAVCVVIQGRREPFGVIEIATRQPRQFNRNELHFIQAVANVLGAVFERQVAETTMWHREHLLRRVLDTNPNFILVKDRAGTVLLANEALALAYHSSVEQIVGAQHHELHQRFSMNMGEVEQWLADDRDVIDSGRPKLLVEPFTHRDGTVHWYRTKKLPFSLGHDQQCVLIISEDITERKAARDELSRLNAELERRVVARTAQLEAANRELEAFSYSISHDLRAPLRAIYGFTQIVQEDYGKSFDTECQRLLDVITNNARRMNQLIDDLLAFSKITRAELAQEPVDMRQLCENVLQDLTLLEPQRTAQVAIGNMIPIKGDPALLQQVWTNLLSNAFKFTRALPQPRIEIGSTNGAQEVTYFVRDNGVGFDMKYVSKLFMVFQRLHRVEQFEGTGVGLAIIQRIVLRHGGRVWAESRPNEGATFFFSLPKDDAT